MELSSTLSMFKNTFNSTFLFKHLIEDIDAVYTAFPEEEYRTYNIDAVASTGFGLHVNAIRDRDYKFFTICQRAVTFTVWRRIHYFITIQFPAGAKIMQVRKIFKVFSLSSLGSHELFPVCAGRIELLSSEGTKFFRNIVSDTIAYRKNNNVVKSDFIYLLMEALQDLTYESSLSTLMICINELANIAKKCTRRSEQSRRKLES
uniref:unspecific monooxygenase n=1 Tax=Spodoptera frugiperda TaxID=7108 RepID=A0A2H1WP33_SPOFR